MSDNERFAIECGIVVAGLIIPFFVWVVMSIYNLKQQNAVMKAQMDTMKEIKNVLSQRRSER